MQFQPFQLVFAELLQQHPGAFFLLVFLLVYRVHHALEPVLDKLPGLFAV